MGASDAALLAKLRAGESSAFAEIYDRHRTPVFGFLVRLCGDRSLAEDLFQATWLKFLGRAGRLLEDSNLRAWLFSVARNEYLSHRRWRRIDITRLLELAAQPPPQDSGLSDELSVLERALALLSASDREVLLLLAEGFDPHEAARILGISDATLRKRLSRARARLSERLAEEAK